MKCFFLIIGVKIAGIYVASTVGMSLERRMLHTDVVWFLTNPSNFAALLTSSPLITFKADLLLVS